MDLLGYNLEIADAVFVPIDIVGTVHVKDTESRIKVGELVDAALDDYFVVSSAEGHVNFSRDVFESDIISLIDNIDGVDHVDLTKLSKQSVLDQTNWNAKTSTISVTISSTNIIEQDIKLGVSHLKLPEYHPL